MQIRSRGLRRRIGWLATVPLSIIAAYLSAALLGAVIQGRHDVLPAGRSHQIYLLRGPIHYDFLVPLDQATKDKLNWLTLDLDHPGANWLVVGWGGREFYTTTGTYRDVSASAVWKGITGDTAVLRIALAGPMEPEWPVYPVNLSESQYLRFLNVLTDSIADRAPLDVPGFSEFDVFYPAHGHFSIFDTCNVWVGETLRRSGVKFGAWTPVPFAVTLSAKLHLP